ncbi:Predicted small secreted protein [Salinibacillus kushneri]|uniref:Predicted small secreted protein n=1 Tax=Salinibacillus kushneri TaxID=237682 RepID=A0A1I0JCY9_9BACI|nr:PepSY domain-containing protein [Salinibacillus kushneri]SEU07901.1 Predicted small secreted protein [Salinibacillus kushneri]
MRYKSLLIGLGVGTSLGFALGKATPDSPLSPEKVLNMTKKKFREAGSISGSWIYMKPESLTRESVHNQVYRGGISRHINGETIQYEFYADAQTGSLIDISKLKLNSETPLPIEE